jgi:predicted restriction endonuclease
MGKQALALRCCTAVQTHPQSFEVWRKQIAALYATLSTQALPQVGNTGSTSTADSDLSAVLEEIQRELSAVTPASGQQREQI